MTDRKALRDFLRGYARLVERDGYLNADALAELLPPFFQLDVERLARALGGGPKPNEAYLHMAETAARQYANDRPDSERGDL